MQPVDDGLWGLRGNENPVPERIDRARQTDLYHARHVRQRRHALRGADGQRDDLTGADVGKRRRERQEVVVDTAGHHFTERFNRAFERNVLRRDAGRHAELLSGEMRRRSDASRRIIQRARLGLSSGDQIGGRLKALRRRGDQHAGGHARRAHRREVLQSVVWQRLARHVGRGERGRVKQDGIAIRLRARGLADRYGAAATTSVLDHDRLTKLLGDLVEQNAGGDIVGVAGCERNDCRDVSGRPVLR